MLDFSGSGAGLCLTLLQLEGLGYLQIAAGFSWLWPALVAAVLGLLEPLALTHGASSRLFVFFRRSSSSALSLPRLLLRLLWKEPETKAFALRRMHYQDVDSLRVVEPC